jgi:DNA polymerase-1
MLRFVTRSLLSVNTAMKDLSLPGVTIVRTPEQAQAAIAVLSQFKDRVHAWDTETIGINVKEESPVGRGYVICASAFLGPEVNFGNGPSTC